MGTEETQDELPEDEEQSEMVGLYCFLSEERMCGAECMAFTTYPKKADSSELSNQQAHCVLLNNADRLGRNVTIAASVLAKSVKKKVLTEADKARAAQFDPKGGPLPMEADTSPFGEKK